MVIKSLLELCWVNTSLSFGGIFASSFADAKDWFLLLHPNLQTQKLLAHFITNVKSEQGDCLKILHNDDPSLKDSRTWLLASLMSKIVIAF